jgi:hypothetical protein
VLRLVVVLDVDQGDRRGDAFAFEQSRQVLEQPFVVGTAVEIENLDGHSSLILSSQRAR